MYTEEPVGEKHRSWLEEFFSPEEAQKAIDGWNGMSSQENLTIRKTLVISNESSYMMYRDAWYNRGTDFWTCFIGGTALHPDFRDRGVTIKKINAWYDTQRFTDPEYNIKEIIATIPANMSIEVREASSIYTVIPSGEYNLVRLTKEQWLLSGNL